MNTRSVQRFILGRHFEFKYLEGVNMGDSDHIMFKQELHRLFSCQGLEFIKTNLFFIFPCLGFHCPTPSHFILFSALSFLYPIGL